MTWKEATIYPEVALKRLLSKSEEWIAPQAEEEYQLLTVRMWGKGIVERGIMKGSEITAKRMYVVRPQQFIISRIDARHGASGVIPDKFDGAITTNEFPIFNTNSSVLIPQYLGWLSKTPDFIELCKVASEGTTNRVRLKEDKFLNLEIPLPPLEEQRRIVARIEELETAIGEARGLRKQSIEEVKNLMSSKELEIWPDDILESSPNLDDVTLYLFRGRQSKQGESNHYLIKTQHVQMGKYIQTDLTLDPYVVQKVSSEAIARPGDTLIACSAAGCLGRVAYYYGSDRIASTDTHVAIARPNPELLLPKYLFLYLRSAQGQKQLRSREKGDWQREKIGFRLTELNVKDMRQVPVPTPSLPEQRRIVAYLDDLQAKIDSLKRLQAETAAELDALLPSILDKAFKGEL